MTPTVTSPAADVSADVSAGVGSGVSTASSASRSTQAQTAEMLPAGVSNVGIGDAAERSGVSVRALRYYQEVGLIHPHATDAGTRRYGADDLARVARIRELQEVLGFQLDEIRAVLTDEDRVNELRAEFRALPEDSAQRRDVAAEILPLVTALQARVEARYVKIRAVRAELAARIMNIQALIEG